MKVTWQLSEPHLPLVSCSARARLQWETVWWANRVSWAY